MAGILALEIGTFILLWLVLVVVETAGLQLARWGEFQPCLRASLIMNLVSAPVLIISLLKIPNFGLAGVVIGAIISCTIEAFLLPMLRKQKGHPHWQAAGTANIASLLVLLLPIWYYTTQI